MIPRVTLLLALYTLGATVSATAAACSVSADGVAFGGYNIFDSTALDSTGTITVQCEIPYTLMLSRSSNNSQFNPRHLATAADDRLHYNLFIDPARTSIWGDGTDGTVTSGGDGDSAAVHHTIHGRIPAGQNARIGTYSDLITVTLEF